MISTIQAAIPHHLHSLALGCLYPWGIALMECVVLCMALAWVFTLLHTGRVARVHAVKPADSPSAWLDCNCSRCRQQSSTGYPLTPIASTSKHSPDGPITIPCPLCHGRLSPSHSPRSRRINLPLSSPRGQRLSWGVCRGQGRSWCPIYEPVAPPQCVSTCHPAALWR